MNTTDLERLVRKYYGYVADLEGSGVEVLDLLFVRDKIQSILDQLTPNEALSSSLYERIYELDSLLWEERSTFLLVVGEEELRHARRGQGSPRSHWWWYLDELKASPKPAREQRERLAQAFAAHKE
ncbi:MAG: hypothetical protein HYY20_09330 [Candidatus Tectomicrobia bacterium]|uniref:Uncharacterized protein n=1 Tax=Tectimicrobiota bacterium TaxID=2528274 RepID=A0A932CPS9_UNCTE|nr:hypothetical protein [Candidatus Tectomicrobia bacterium]